jgi:hypothetical protein
MNVKSMQVPVNTEQIATRRPWGALLSPFCVRGRVKCSTFAGTLGTSTSLPSTARHRKPFQSMAGPKRSSYRAASTRHIPRQKRKESFSRARQNASSVTHFGVNLKPASRNQPQPSNKPCVMDVVWRATVHMSQNTFSGVSTRTRMGVRPAAAATALKSSGRRMARNVGRPNWVKIRATRPAGEPILDMRVSPECRLGMQGCNPAFIYPSAFGDIFISRC